MKSQILRPFFSFVSLCFNYRRLLRSFHGSFQSLDHCSMHLLSKNPNPTAYVLGRKKVVMWRKEKIRDDFVKLFTGALVLKLFLCTKGRDSNTPQDKNHFTSLKYVTSDEHGRSATKLLTHHINCFCYYTQKYATKHRVKFHTWQKLP